MRTYQYAHKKRASEFLRTSVSRPSEVQSSVKPLPIQAKSNEEGLAEHAERLRKFQRLGNPFLDKGPPRFDNDMTSPLQPKPWIQRKLTLGQPGDKYEQEADRVASQVVQQINAPAFSQSNQGQSVQRKKAQYGEMQANCIRDAIQRRQAMAGGEASPDLESAINTARGSGQPLDAGLQQSMGQAMRADFSGVRVHTDTQSDQLNQSIQARAFTTGQDVFFRGGAYQPGNRGGQELIAHELTHVVQQSRGLKQAEEVSEIVRSQDPWIDQFQNQLAKQAPNTHVNKFKAERLGEVRAKIAHDKSSKETSKVKQSLIPIGNSSAIIQRLVGRVEEDKPKDRKKSEDFVTASEVDRMVTYLIKEHGGPEVDVQTEDNIVIDAGEHWFAGHGNVSMLGGLDAGKFNSKLDFSKLRSGEEVTLNIMSCNLGVITEIFVFAKDLRRIIQNDKDNKGKIIIIKAAPSFIIHTEKVQASYPAKDAQNSLREIQEEMSNKEKEIDEKYGKQLLSQIKPDLKDEAIVKKLPTKKKLNSDYKQAFSDKKNAQILDKYTKSKSDDERKKFIEVLEEIANQDGKGFLYSASKLIELINVERVTNIYGLILEEIKKESEELWLSIEDMHLKKQQDKSIPESSEVLRASDNERKVIKEKLKVKDPEARSKYGWIEYSTKGKYKEVIKTMN